MLERAGETLQESKEGAVGTTRRTPLEMWPLIAAKQPHTESKIVLPGEKGVPICTAWFQFSISGSQI